MCGITGYIGKDTLENEKIIGLMTKAISHRGPDEDGFYVDKYVGLGMRRLSIIDLSTGKQPITSEDDKTLIFFNGEIYNYHELHSELVGKGFKFKTQSDTEVILNMYLAYGEEMLTRLRGMFTFCIYDIGHHKAFIARDFFGIKPLYYSTNKDKITAFSSEIKSILEIPGFKREVNDEAVYNYLSFQYNPLSETFFKNIYKLPPGHFMELDTLDGTAEIKKYWSFELKPDNKLNEAETTAKIQKTVEDSVAHHMIADVPVGSFLSGGVDSSIIATMMQKIRGDNPSSGAKLTTGQRKIKTFTVGFDTLTEGVEASETSDFLGTDHTEIKIGPDEYFDALPKAVWHFDEPVADPSAIGLYFVAREARKHVKVVLSGEGADELFGGYNIYLEPFARAKISWLPKSIFDLLLKIPFEFFGKNYIRRGSKKLSNWYIGNASIFKDEERDALWKGAEQKKYNLASLYKKVSTLPESNQMQYIDVETWLIGDILAKADKMTMAHSLELRVPFLDKKVSDLAVTLPDSFKWRNGVTKYLLRNAFQNVIPETTRNRKKLGFPTPVRNWFTAERQEMYDLILENKYISSHMDTKYIQKLITDHIAKKEDNSRKIYLLLMLALWYDVFIKKAP